MYDVPSKATSGEDQDESTELYAYCVCAVCPVELAKPALGYREDENRIGARERDWVVGLPSIDVQLRTSEHRSMYSYVRLSIDRCTATYV